jgi:hypothetical protein
MSKLQAPDVETLNALIQKSIETGQLPYGHPFVEDEALCQNVVAPECLPIHASAIYWQDDGYRIKFHKEFTYKIIALTEENDFRDSKIASPVLSFKENRYVAVMQENRDTKIVCNLFSAICSTFPFYPQ